MTHIYLVAPSYKVSEEDLVFTKAFLESQGMRVSLPEGLIGDHLLCANTDEKRFFYLCQAFEDPTVDVIWMAAGGYGMTRLMPTLSQLPKPAKKKLFIGFSDGTPLHLFLNQCWGWPSIHGSTACQIAKQRVSPRTVQVTLDLLQRGLASYQSPSLIPLNKRSTSLNVLAGEVRGGNLCLLDCSLGTDWQIQAAEKILFLEDIDERGYRIDRMLTHLDQAKVFEKVKAIILGDFSGGEEEDNSSLVELVLEQFVKNIDIPVFRLPDAGHGSENTPLPFNVPLTFPIEHP